MIGRSRATVAFASVVVLLGCRGGIPPRPAPTPATVGIVDAPCPPPLVKPAGVIRGYELLLVPGALPRESFPPPDGPAEQLYWAETEQRRLTDWPELCRYPDENVADLARGPIRAVFLGDSITEFWKMASPAFFPSGIVDRGISGQATGQMVLRFQADVAALKPRVLHLLGGTNDVAGNTGPQRPVDVENNLRTMAELARVHGIGVILGTIPPADRFFWNKGVDPRPRIAELNAWIRDYAREQGLAVADYHAALANPDGSFRDDLSNDGVHPNAAGYRVMEAVLGPLLESTLPR